MSDTKRKLPWLTSGDRLALAVVCTMLIALLGVHVVLGAGWAAAPAQLEPGGKVAGHRIDINRAAWWELQALQGIGGRRAGDIVAYREQHGPFESVADLVKVRGIGKKTLERLRPHLIASRQETDDGQGP
jgi:competence protein ComEA